MLPSKQLRVLGWLLCVAGVLLALVATSLLLELHENPIVGRSARDVALPHDLYQEIFKGAATIVLIYAGLGALLGFVCTRPGWLGRTSALLLGGLSLSSFSAAQVLPSGLGPIVEVGFPVIGLLPAALVGSYFAALGLAPTFETRLRSRLPLVLRTLLPLSLAGALFAVSSGARALIYPYSIEGRFHRQFDQAAQASPPNR